MTTRVLLLDGDAMFRSGVRRLLGAHGLGTAGEAASLAAGVELAAGEAPDVILVDAALADPLADGVRRLQSAAPRTALVAVVAGPNGDAALEAVRAGAAALLLREGPLDDIPAAVQAAAAGDGYVPRALAGPFLARVRSLAPPAPSGGEGIANLSPRQREVLQLVALGCDNAEIAARLGISVATARNHVSQLLLKLDVDNRIKAAVTAVRHGLA